MNTAGALKLIATPIGNLKDITIRALEELKNSDIIAAEDTRHSGRLLKEYGIETKMISLHKFNEKQKSDKIINMIHEGKNVALISDAGTPGICDPGQDIVKACIKENIKVTVIPGANALIAAYAVSGMSAASFTFHGFMPKRKKEKEELLNMISSSHHCNIFYESPFRIIDTLQLIKNIMPNRYIVLVRELTKLHEEILRGSAEFILQTFSDREPKGEFVVLIEVRERNDSKKENLDLKNAAEMVNEYMKKGDKKTVAIKKVCAEYNVDRKELYNSLKND